VIVSENGKIGYTNAAGNYVDMNQTIGLFQFNNPSGLEKVGTNLLAVTPASGNAMNESTTANLTKSKVLQNYLEGSNVQVADEMVNLIIAQRAYQLNSKAITTSDEMLEQANNLKR
jgi:flagellar basal-body rod protein FlgG